MATARCYTKSGSVEKYESNLWSSPSLGNWSSLGIVGKITTPDSNGNYTVTPALGYGDANGQTEFYCYTMYGGVRKTFYFYEQIIKIYLYIQENGRNHDGYVSFDCVVSGGTKYDTSPNKEIINNILRNNSIYLSWKVATNKGPFGNYRTRLTSVGSLILNTGSYYSYSNQYYMSSAYCDPSSGIYSNGNRWKTSVSLAT